MAAKQRIGRGKKLAFTMIAAALLCATAEVGWRAYLYSTGRGFFDDPRKFTSPFFTTYEEPMPQHVGETYYYRNGHVTEAKREGEVRVLCLGGSTTVNMRAGVSYPELLERRFAEHRKDDLVRVLNAGGEGFSSAHSLVNLALRNLDVAPDVVVGASEDPVRDAAILAVLDRYMEGLNALDVEAHVSTYHFPHYRHAGGEIVVWSDAGEAMPILAVPREKRREALRAALAPVMAEHRENLRRSAERLFPGIPRIGAIADAVVSAVQGAALGGLVLSEPEAEERCFAWLEDAARRELGGV